jgi:hypothetical protein
MKHIHFYTKEISFKDDYFVGYHNKVKILSISHKNDFNYYSEIVLDGTLLLNTNPSEELVNIELMLPSSKWKRDKNLLIPKAEKKARIFLPDIEKIDHKIEKTPVYTFYNQEINNILISIDKDISKLESIEFSKNCQVLYRDIWLIGFFIQYVL